MILIVLLVLISGGWWGGPLLAGILGMSGVTDKPSALRSIVQLMRNHGITPAEVEAAFHAPADLQPELARRSRGEIAKTLLFYLGAIFILADISAYIGTFWQSMYSAMRIAVTLGVVLIVLIHEVFPRGDNWRLAVLFVFGVMALHQGALLGVHMTYIAIVLGASLFLTATAFEDTPHRIVAMLALLIGICWLNGGLFDRIAMAASTSWTGLVTGVCVIFTAYGLHKARRHPGLTGLGYFVGAVMAYGGQFDLVRNTPVELLYLAVTASMLYASVVLRSRALSFITVITMLSFIGYYSAKHFANSLGWSVTLMLMGVAFLSVSTIALKLKQCI